MNGYAGATLVLTSAALSMLCHGKGKRSYSRGKHARIPCSTSIRSALVFISITTVLFGCASFLSDAPYLMELHNLAWLESTGILVSFAGLGLSSSARRSLGAQYSPCFDSWLPQELVRKGPYRYVRHPIYMGHLMVLAGLFLATGSLWIGDNIVLLFFYYDCSASSEEQSLTLQFCEYESYSESTGRYLPKRSSLSSLHDVVPTAPRSPSRSRTQRPHHRRPSPPCPPQKLSHPSPSQLPRAASCPGPRASSMHSTSHP